MSTANMNISASYNVGKKMGTAFQTLLDDPVDHPRVTQFLSAMQQYMLYVQRPDKIIEEFTQIRFAAEFAFYKVIKLGILPSNLTSDETECLKDMIQEDSTSLGSD